MIRLVIAIGVVHSDQAPLSPTEPKPGNIPDRLWSTTCFRVVCTQNQQQTQFGDASIPATSAPVCITVK